jgi:hypothetical protein
MSLRRVRHLARNLFHNYERCPSNVVGHFLEAKILGIVPVFLIWLVGGKAM